jgi:hypothetical protein
MNWRALLGILVGLLLPVPLVLLLSHVLTPRPGGPTPEGTHVSPVLDAEERAQRVTYRRRCLSAAECESPLGCLSDERLGRHYCTDSQCVTDLQCPEGQVCRAMETLEGGPLVRFCVSVGVRQEGERCVRLPRDQGAACGPGLLCAGEPGQRWCARPCRQEESASCPESFFCADVFPQPVCLPTCEARRCPEGQQCFRFDAGASACVVVYGPDCLRSPCPEGRKCEVSDEPRNPGKVWTECVERCGEGFPPCTPGLICDGWQCKSPCDPEAPNVCAEGYRCLQRRPDHPWVCQPDRWSPRAAGVPHAPPGANAPASPSPGE